MMDGIDRRIALRWHIMTIDGTGYSLVIEESASQRNTISMTFRGNSTALTLGDIAAMIRMLTEAKERLEAFGPLEALEKAAP